MILSFYNRPLMCLLFLLLSGGAGAAELPPFDFKAGYDFTLGGVVFGRMGIEAEQKAMQYDIAADIATTGIARLFARHSSHTTVSAHGSDRDYRTDYRTRKKKKSVEMTTRGGKVTKVVVTPPEPPEKRPPVATAMASAAYDPLSFLMEIRRRLHRALEENRENFSLNLYDGRRLTKASFAVLGRRQILLHGKKTRVVTVGLRRTPLAGFNKSELAEIDSNEPTVYLHFSDDGRLMPLMAETTLWFGPLAATLTKECRTGESCLLGIRE